MLHQQLIPLDEKQTWDRILHGLPHGVCHTHGYNRAIAYTHPEPVFLYHAWDDEGFETICPFKVRAFDGHLDITTPYGLSGFSTIGHLPSFEDHWRKFCGENKWVCGYISQHPEFTSPLSVEGDMGRTNLFCTLEDPKEMTQRLHPTYRYDIKRLDAGVMVAVNDKGVIAALPRLYQETISTKDASPLYDFSERTLLYLAGLPESVCLGAIINGDVVAVALFPSCGTYADYFCGASTKEGRKFSKILVWKALQELQSRGIHQVNLGGGVAEGDTLEQFKKRFGSKPLQTTNYKIIFDETLYHKLSESTPNTAYFPAYRAG